MLSVKEHKFAEMSTWQQEQYVQVQVRVLQKFKTVIEYKYKYQVCI